MRKPTSPLGRFAIAAGAALMLGLAPAAFADETVALKNALYGAGYNVTNVSPQMDDSTRAALTQFQKDQGLQATGIIDKETKRALGMVSVRVAAAASPAASTKPSIPAKTKMPAPAKQEVVEKEEDDGWSLW